VPQLASGPSNANDDAPTQGLADDLSAAPASTTSSTRQPQPTERGPQPQPSQAEVPTGDSSTPPVPPPQALAHPDPAGPSPAPSAPRFAAFEEEMRQQAAELATTMFGELLLHTIGGVYIASANRYLGKGSLSKSVDGTKAYWKQKRHTYGTHITAAKSMIKMYKASKNVKAEDEQKVPEAKDMATFLEGAWNVSVLDVESTLRHICKKVLTDTSVSKQELSRRAEAMLRVGAVFLATESPDSKTDDGKKKTLRESLEAFVGPLSGGPAYEESDDEEAFPSHSVTLTKATAAEAKAAGVKKRGSGFGFELSSKGLVTSVVAGSVASASVALGDKLVAIGPAGNDVAPPLWTCAEAPERPAAAALAAVEAGATVTISLCSAAARAAAKAAKATQMLPPGVLITVHGLQAAAQHNDKRGIVLEFDGENGRYIVQLEDGQTLKVQPKNVSPLDGGAAFGGAAGGSAEVPDAAERVLSRSELEAMSVKELKALLSARGLSSEGCIEKTDFVNQLLLAQPGAE